MRLKKYQSIFENSISLFALKAIDLGLTIGLIPFLIVKVGIHNYGIYAFAMALLLFMVNIMNYGFNLSTVREIAKHKNDQTFLNNCVNEVFSVKLLLYAILMGILILLVCFVPKFENHSSLYLFGSLILFSEVFSTRWFFFGLEKMKYITLMSLVGNLIFVILVLVYVTLEQDFVYIALFEGIGMSVATIGGFFLIVKKFNFRLRLLSLKQIWMYLKINFSSFINLLLPSTYTIILIFIAGLIVLPSELSFLQLSLKLTAIFSTVVTILTTVFYPVVNRNSSWFFVMRLLLMGSGLVLSIVMFVMAEFIVDLWMPFNERSSLETLIRLIKILSVAPMFIAVNSVFGVNGLLIKYKDLQYQKSTLISIISMIATGVIFIPIYPIYGGVVSFLIGRFVYAVLSLYYFKFVE
ncbi:MAG: oligosaccharide flippase family protein [Flavicella sp.]|nr:oligosaccharide flippase family protein [Flavicella sp.]